MPMFFEDFSAGQETKTPARTGPIGGGFYEIQKNIIAQLMGL